jgi:hypothetical protein
VPTLAALLPAASLHPPPSRTQDLVSRREGCCSGWDDLQKLESLYLRALPRSSPDGYYPEQALRCIWPGPLKRGNVFATGVGDNGTAASSTIARPNSQNQRDVRKRSCCVAAWISTLSTPSRYLDTQPGARCNRYGIPGVPFAPRLCDTPLCHRTSCPVSISLSWALAVLHPVR